MSTTEAHLTCHQQLKKKKKQNPALMMKGFDDFLLKQDHFNHIKGTTYTPWLRGRSVISFGKFDLTGIPLEHFQGLGFC